MHDMQTFLVDDTGDLELDGQNNIRMVDGADEKIQAVKLLLRTNAGEWFLDTSHGLAYFDILGQKPNDELIRAAFTEAFAQEPRIEEVLSLTFDYDGTQRRLTINFRLRMDGEEIEGQEVV